MAHNRCHAGSVDHPGARRVHARPAGRAALRRHVRRLRRCAAGASSAHGAGGTTGGGLSRRPRHQLHARGRTRRHIGWGALCGGCAAAADWPAGGRFADAAGDRRVALRAGRVAQAARAARPGNLASDCAVRPPRVSASFRFAGAACGTRVGVDSLRDGVCRVAAGAGRGRPVAGRRGDARVRRGDLAQHAGGGCGRHEARWQRQCGPLRQRTRLAETGGRRRSSLSSGCPGSRTRRASPVPGIRPSKRWRRSATAEGARRSVGSAQVSFPQESSRSAASPRRMQS